jgi:hypothetical protein
MPPGVRLARLPARRAPRPARATDKRRAQPSRRRSLRLAKAQDQPNKLPADLPLGVPHLPTDLGPREPPVRPAAQPAPLHTVLRLVRVARRHPVPGPKAGLLGRRLPAARQDRRGQCRRPADRSHHHPGLRAL